MTPAVRRLGAAVALAAVALLTAACLQGSPNMSERPPIDDVVAEYDDAVAGIQQIVSAEYPDATWAEDGEPSRAAGRGDGTVIVTSQIWYADAPLAADEAARDRVVQQANEVVRAHGFADFSVVSTGSGTFSYVTGDEWGGELHFAGSKNVTVRYVTGSHPEG